MQENSNFESIPFKNDTINLREVLEKYLYHWKFFSFGILIAMSLAFLYLKFATYEYKVSSTILINDEDNGGGKNSEISVFEDLGLFEGPKTSLDTEMGILKSKTLIAKVIKDLKLNIIYYIKNGLISKELYGNEIPFNINFFMKDSILNSLNTEFSITALSKTKYILSDSDGRKIGDAFFGERISGGFCDLIVTPIDIKNVEIGQTILIKIVPVEEAAIVLKRNIQVVQDNIKSNLLTLTLQNPVKSKAIDILDNLVIVYNKEAVFSNSQIAQITDEFIRSRIEDISIELTNLDQGVQTYKSKNFLSNLDSESSVVMNSNAELNNQISELTSRIKLIDYVTDYMKTNKDELIPANLGLLNETTSQNTVNYNNLVLERNRLLKSANTDNPLIANLSDQINSLRVSIDRSLINIRSSLVITLAEVKSQEERLNSRISATPKKEREIRDIEREQEIYETLYLYLLQKKEENSISLAVSAPNATIIDKAYGTSIPVAPRKLIVLLSSMLLGVLVPGLYLALRSLLDNKVHSVEDVENVIRAPILGDIPNTNSKKKLIAFEKERSAVSESLRLLRTNVNYMLSNNNNGGNTIFITSSVAGEGKTFIAINLASVFTLLNKKVLLIGADIRKPRIAAYLQIKKDRGLVQFLTDRSLNIKELIKPYKGSTLDILTSGGIPPNPSELLTNGRFDEVIAYGRENYDYIIVDTVPINLATDTLLISNHADLFIYVIRANFLNKRLLKIPKNMSENKRLPNLTLLLNGTNYKKSGYYSMETYGERVSRTWWRRILNFKMF